MLSIFSDLTIHRSLKIRSPPFRERLRVESSYRKGLAKLRDAIKLIKTKS